MDSITRKREQEKRVVSEMIALYCHKHHGAKHGLCDDCAALEEYARSAAIIVHLWRRKPFAPTAVYIAINRKCERRFAK